MTKPPEEADDFSVGENASRIIHMDEDDRDDTGPATRAWMTDLATSISLVGV